MKEPTQYFQMLVKCMMSTKGFCCLFVSPFLVFVKLALHLQCGIIMQCGIMR